MRLKKTIVIAVLLVLVVIIVGIFVVRNIWSDSSQNSFFIWQDGYLAAAQDEQVDVAFTFLSNDPSLDTKVVSMGVPDNENVEITNFNVEKMDQQYEDYEFYSIVLTLQFTSTGKSTMNQLSMNLADGLPVTYSIGDWTLDIGDADDGKIWTWESPAVSSNSEEFAFSYTAQDASVTSCDLTVGTQTSVELTADDEQTFSGKIELMESDAPVKYIRSKLTYCINGKTVYGYGKGCYCGALEFDEKGIIASRNHFI
ncbi:hypothetical protein [Eubacterium oxidoreducens]|uniref:Uncharacterized protein n=1 Tax=Eubacterium oxidoreducens TaxID=1732 RepID=A0A1G6A6E8_EUBOX|nr:hypothetical protein [Eubacterium oxidoreducens]SDB04041.1 hypothetical protein SAMN02910417_00319 [Eubacterium oxidoreducens]